MQAFVIRLNIEVDAGDKWYVSAAPGNSLTMILDKAKLYNTAKASTRRAKGEKEFRGVDVFVEEYDLVKTKEWKVK